MSGRFGGEYWQWIIVAIIVAAILLPIGLYEFSRWYSRTSEQRRNRRTNDKIRIADRDQQP